MSMMKVCVTVISVLHVLIYPGSFSFELHTERFLTAVRGKNISLPCSFSVPPLGVYWYKYASTGEPNEYTTLVAREYDGDRDPIPGYERFIITKGYSLVIHNISIHDETNYSCTVFSSLGPDERGYTDLRVIALAEPLEPVIESCVVTAPGRCSFTIYDYLPEQVHLVCKISNVRPAPNLTWTDSHGRLLESAAAHINEVDGLFEVSSLLQVSVEKVDDQYFCQAEGEAVNGTSSMKVTFDVKGSHDGWIIGVTISGVLISAIIVALIMVVIKMKKQIRLLANELLVQTQGWAYRRYRLPVIAESPNTNFKPSFNQVSSSIYLGSGSVQVSEGIETNNSSDHGEKPDSENGSLISFSESAQDQMREVTDEEITLLSELLPHLKCDYMRLCDVLGISNDHALDILGGCSEDLTAAYVKVLHEWKDKDGLMKYLDGALQKAELRELMQQYKN